jgi:glycosyltransferase involved in cell wall biosynthesis
MIITNVELLGMTECRTKEGSEESKPKLTLLRGGYDLHSIGKTDWRIGLFMPRFGFETWLFLIGDATAAKTGDVQVVEIRTPIRLPVLYTVVTALLAARRLLRLRPEILVCQPGFALTGIVCKATYPGIKIVVDVRSVPVECRGLLGWANRAWFDVALRLDWFDAATVISDGMLDALDNQYHLRQRVPTAVWGSAFDEGVFKPNVDGAAIRRALGLQNEFVLMFHGALSLTRGLTQVVRGLRLLRDQGTDDVVLVLVGAGAAETHLTGLAAELGVTDQVIVVPPVPHTEIPRWIAGADLGLDPLPDHPWWRHQSSLKVYEYLAMGKPVLATDIPCHRGISEAVILVSDNDPSTLAEGIQRMKELPVEEMCRMEQAALRDVRPHTWSARARTLADFLYDQVLGR